MEIGKLPAFFVCVLLFLSTSYTYKTSRHVFKAKCSSFSSGINWQRKLSINKISPMGKILLCFQLITLKKIPDLTQGDKIYHNCFGFVREWGFPLLKSLQGLHLPLSYLTDHLDS